MNHLCTRTNSLFVGCFQIRDLPADLRPLCDGTVLRCIEGKVKESAFGPRHRSVASAGPAIVSMRVADVKIKSETIGTTPTNYPSRTPRGRQRQAGLSPRNNIARSSCRPA